MFSVLHCPEQVGGNPAVLSKFEKELGLSSICISEKFNLYAADSDQVLQTKNRPTWLTELYSIRLILKAFTQPGVVHLNNGRFITPFFGNGLHPREVSYSNFARKLIRLYALIMLNTEKALYPRRRNQQAVFVTFQGSDARETKCFIEKYQRNGLAQTVIGRSGQSNHSIRQKKILLSETADKIYSLNPDLLEVLPQGAEFLPYATESTLGAKVLPFIDREEFVVGHAPTHRIVKGTTDVINVVEKLRSKGHKIRLELIEGLSRNEAQKKFEGIDLFIDQLVIGWYGVVSLEVLALGKPVICFLDGKGMRFVPKAMLDESPMINADSNTLKNEILRIMKMNHMQRSRLAEQGISYLKKWHDPKQISQRVVNDYKSVLAGRHISCV